MPNEPFLDRDTFYTNNSYNSEAVYKKILDTEQDVKDLKDIGLPQVQEDIEAIQEDLQEKENQIGSLSGLVNVLNEPKYIISASTLPMYTSAEVGKEGYDIEAALNAAFAALPNGGYVQLPKGRLYSSPISVPPRIKLVGAGQYVTRLMLKNTKNTDFIKFDQAEYAGIRDMAIDGNKWNNLTAGSCILIKNSAITSANSRNLEIENLTVVDAREHGIKVTKPNVWIFQLRNIKVDNCEGYGVWNDATDNSFYAIDVFGCKKGGIFESGNNNRWIGGKAYVNGDAANPNNAGFTLSGAKRVQVVGFEVQDDKAHGFLITGSQDCTLTNILADGNGSLVQNTSNPAYADGIKIINSHGIIVQGTSSSYTPCQRKPYTIDSASYKITMMIQGDGNKETAQVDSQAQINIFDTTTQSIITNNLRAVGVPYVKKEPYHTLNSVESVPSFSTLDITGLNLSYTGASTAKELVVTMGNVLLSNTWTIEWEMEFSSLPSGFVDFGTISFGDATTYRLSLGNAFGYTPAMYVQSATYTTGVKANEQIVTNKVYKCSLVRTPTSLTFWVNGLFSTVTSAVNDSATGISSIVFRANNSNYSYIIRNVLVSSKSKPSYEISSFVRDDSTLIFMPLQSDLRYGKGVQTMLSDSVLRLKSPNGAYFDQTASNKGTVTYNGDGAAVTKTIAHGLGAIPSVYYVQKASSGIPAIDSVTADATNLTVTFVSAPPSGTNNVVLKWKAEV